jgi:NAD(P)-dependent dehydrogenase (short-subunit alcohol dehydrogenase family)
MPGKLDGKVAIIMGATSGMGRATALQFAREGAKLVISGRRPGLLQELGEQIVAETGAVALGMPCDAQNREQVQGVISAARAQFGRIDVFVYATGTNLPQRGLSELTPENWDMMIGTNLTGAFHCTQLVLPVMREQQDGLIIYISSISALRAEAVSGVSYQAAKRGLDGISGAVNAEEKPNGIRASVIYPGFCDTPLVLKRPKATPPEILAKALQPEDVADACLFVASLPPRCLVPQLELTTAQI